jgi:hypothetical protein
MDRPKRMKTEEVSNGMCSVAAVAAADDDDDDDI